jgi:hypothetical protein
MEIEGRPEHYIATGKFVCLQHPIDFTAKTGPDSKEVTL